MSRPKQIIFATHNPHKVKEIRKLISSNIQIRSLVDLEYHAEIAETGATLEENAEIKAKTIYEVFQVPVFAEDTGLEVASLGGRPGVRSARYAGEERDAHANMDLILSQLQESTDRKARFRTVIAYIDKKGTHLFEGIVKGTILLEKRGSYGFGYDPIFQPWGKSNSFAQMTDEEKNQISHRARAMQRFLSWIEKN